MQHIRSMRGHRSLLPFLRYLGIASALALALAGFIVSNIGAARTVHSFDTIRKSVQLSEHLQHLMRSYNAFRWVAFGFGLAALLLAPLMVAAALHKQAKEGRQGSAVSQQLSMKLHRILTFLATILSALATVAAVMSIAAQLKASDKAAEDLRLASTGGSMINQTSSTLASIQSSNSSTTSPVDLVSTLLGLLGGGSAASTGTDALSALSSADSFQSLYQVIAPMQVQTLIKLIDPAPQSLLQLSALLSSLLGQGNSGLTCSKTCLNAGDACICNVSQLSFLTLQNSNIGHQTHVSLIGACIMGFGFALITAFGIVFLVEMKCAHGSPTLPCPAEGNGGEEAGYNTRDVQLAMHPTNGPLNDAGASQKKDSSRSPRKDGHSVPIQALAVDF